ncbi:MAG TPA: heme peroxidase family protein [Acidimicrobiales bacterium]|nr:heme peroxidase family protein [Acidimicrobiales bacterium]
MAEQAPHGSFQQRGQDAPAKNREVEGRFGFMFKHLQPFSPPDELLRALAETMRQPPRDPANPAQFENPAIPAGYTFFGQFVDHDITADRLSQLDKQQDPDGLKNFRTPSYDLDSVYAGGPQQSPQCFDGPKMRLDLHDGIEDLPRKADGTADIGDPRNEENAIIHQLQIAMIKFHNACVDHLAGQGTPQNELFPKAQAVCQRYYQWAVLTDFIPRICGQAAVDAVLKKPSGNAPIRADLRFYKPKQTPFMPLEFAVAAYRFGHSQIRAGYALRDNVGAAFFQPQASERNLNGFRPLLPDLKVDWQNFFDIPGAQKAPQPSQRIDSKLSGPLFQLPFGGEPKSLAERNLLRGKALKLPSGQAVAEAMGFKPLTNAELGFQDDPGWGGQAPLWYYVLKEAELQNEGTHLGDVGGRIVAETLVGLLVENRNSFFRLDPNFQPAPPMAPQPGQFRMGDLLKFAGAA